MYWLDPARRGSRAALLRPRRVASQAVQHDDARLRDRVRARLGTLVSHPGAIDVRVDHSVVRLGGHVLAKELDGLLFQVRDIDGVHRVANALTAHDTPDDLVAAQGTGTLRRRRVQPA